MGFPPIMHFVLRVILCAILGAIICGIAGALIGAMWSGLDGLLKWGKVGAVGGAILGFFMYLNEVGDLHEGGGAGWSGD